jgi:hypothetical protein
MKEALVLIMLALLILPLLVGVRRIRRLPRDDSHRRSDPPPSHSGERRDA